MKTVFDRFDVAHLWAHQLQEQAHDKSGSFYFIDDTIYSYGAHFPIAQVVSYKNRKMYVFNTDYYSTSTARHCSVVRQCIPHKALTFHVSGCESPDVKNGLPRDFASAMNFIGEKLKGINKLLYRQKRARTYDYRDEIISAISEIANWINFWELSEPRKWLPSYLSDIKCMKRQPSVFQYWDESNYDTIKKECLLNDNDTSTGICLFSLINKIFDLTEANYIPKQVDKLLIKFFQKSSADQINASIKKAKIRYKRRLNILAKQALADSESKLKAWQCGEREEWYSGPEFREKYGFDTALRINNNHIETSKHITISFDEAHRLWFIIKAFDEGKEFRHDLALDLSDRKWKLDGYRNHVLFAGCHSIPFSECQRIADIMHWQ